MMKRLLGKHCKQGNGGDVRAWAVLSPRFKRKGRGRTYQKDDRENERIGRRRFDREGKRLGWLFWIEGREQKRR